MDLSELRVFLAVVSEGSFSKAAARLERTQPTISLAVQRLEERVGQRLLDRSTNPGTLTEAGKVLKEYGERLIRLADEAQTSLKDIDELRRGRVLVGTNDAGVPVLLPIVARFQRVHANILVDIRRVHARHVAVEVLHGNLDFGLLTFDVADLRLEEIALGDDEMVVVTHPSHPFAKKKRITVVEWAREPIVFHNDPSPARERALALAEEHRVHLNVRVAVPTLDGIKAAVEAQMGISLLPKRCVLDEVRRKQLAAIPIPELRLPRQMRLVYRRRPELSVAAAGFLKFAAPTRPRDRGAQPATTGLL
jgi:DNA-binding transcriptional LysR family regulator